MAEAVRYIPGGVDSPVRAFRAVGGEPLFIRRASGSRVYDEDGNEFIDYVGSWGPLVLGHAHPEVVRAVQEAAAEGTSFGAPTWREVELARMVVEAVPSVEMVRFVNSGTEATMSAIRLARAWTHRDRIIKFDGCYHGHADGFLVKAGSGSMTLGVPDSPGVPSAYTGLTVSATYNDLESVEVALRAFPDSVAAILVEPVAGNMGVVPPVPGFLAGLRELATRYGALLIFDEVITGFRVARGGAQELYGVLPDLTCFGKVIGGGLPVGAYGGRKQIMEMVSPSGPVYQAGTLSGNPLAMAAGIATLQCLSRPGAYDELERKAARLERGLREAAALAGVPMVVNRVGSMLTSFFTDREVVDYESARASDTRRYATFFRGMLGRGVYLAPSQFEAAFVSMAHTDEDLDMTVRAAAETLRTMASGAVLEDTG